jgi:hypothetical protein
MLAPSLHHSQPWRFIVHADGLDVRADRTRHLTSIDPLGRELVQSVGAALFNARVALAARGWAVDVQRCPSPDEPDLLAVLHLVDGPPDPGLAVLDPWSPDDGPTGARSTRPFRRTLSCGPSPRPPSPKVPCWSRC